MATIWKYRLAITDLQVVFMPHGARILSAGVQNEELCVWAKVEPGTRVRMEDEIEFRIAGTGPRLDPDMGQFLTTFMMSGGRFVGHLFYKRR